MKRMGETYDQAGRSTQRKIQSTGLIFFVTPLWHFFSNSLLDRSCFERSMLSCALLVMENIFALPGLLL